MKIRFPLYAKILGWFFLNLLFLGAVFFIVARGQFHFGLDSLISGPAGDRLQSAAQLIAEELRDRPQSEWSALLQRFNDAYQVNFFLFRDERQVAGAEITLPSEVRDRMTPRRGMNQPPPRDEVGQRDRRDIPPDAMTSGPPREEMRLRGPAEMQKFMVHTSSPSRYWVIMRIFIPEREPSFRPAPLFLLAESTSLSGGGLFFDLTAWVVVGAAVVLISVLFWLPLVSGITRAISRMTLATEKIAGGNFEVRTHVRRGDELGSLSEAINRMAMRLAGFVAGQKRFLGDIAHELCSPIARIQVALGILEQRADEKQRSYIEDLREEVQQMSGLVNELLSFSKASLGGKAIRLEAVALRAVAEKAASREGAAAGAEIIVNLPEDLRVMAEPELMQRAVGNVLRNAIRYAGGAGPVTLSAAREGAKVKFCIEDCGPGIPEAALAQVFDPFYRVDPSRDRETGGVGLGLSIVKTCIESCGGNVRCENRETGGLRVVMMLAAAD